MAELEPELMHRMWHRYLMCVDPRPLQVTPTLDATPKVPNVAVVMAALADEVRTFDGERLAARRTGHHDIGMVHASHEGCGICDLKRAGDMAKLGEHGG